MATARISVVNAIIWIILFFASRILLGTIMTYLYMVDLFKIWRTSFSIEALGESEYAKILMLRQKGFNPQPVNDAWVLACVASAAILTVLNWAWFYMIISTTIRRVSGRNFGKREGSERSVRQ